MVLLLKQWKSRSPPGFAGGAREAETHSHVRSRRCGANSFGAGWSSPVARQAHNLKVAGSNPAPATTSTCEVKRPGFSGGGFIWVMQPYRGSLGLHNSSLTSRSSALTRPRSLAACAAGLASQDRFGARLLATPAAQRLGRAANLGGNRTHRCPLQGIIASVLLHHTQRAVAELRRKLVPCSAHRGSFSHTGAPGKPGTLQGAGARCSGRSLLPSGDPDRVLTQIVRARPAMAYTPRRPIQRHGTGQPQAARLSNQRVTSPRASSMSAYIAAPARSASCATMAS